MDHCLLDSLMRVSCNEQEHISNGDGFSRRMSEVYIQSPPVRQKIPDRYNVPKWAGSLCGLGSSGSPGLYIRSRNVELSDHHARGQPMFISIEDAEFDRFRFLGPVHLLVQFGICLASSSPMWSNLASRFAPSGL